MKKRRSDDRDNHDIKEKKMRTKTDKRPDHTTRTLYQVEGSAHRTLEAATKTKEFLNSTAPIIKHVEEKRGGGWFDSIEPEVVG